MPSLPTAPVVAAGLIGGYAIARGGGHRRELGTLVFTAAGAWSTHRWLRGRGPATAGMLLGTYLAAFGVSHPLARRLGAWPSVLAVSAVAAGASHALADRGTSSS